MNKKDRLKNIENMENIFNELDLSLKDLEKFFFKWKLLFPKYIKLIDYYGSEIRKKDYDDVNNGKLKPKWPHWILSEDTIYDFYENQKELCKVMIETSNKILGN